MLERILIPLDGSETAEKILPQVRRLLKRHRSEVILLRAINAYPADAHLSGPDLEREAKLYVRKHVFELIQDGTPARGFVRVGNVAETILETAERERATMIAMATHGRTGLPRWTFGSITEKVLRAGSVPTLVVRSFPPAVEGGISKGRLEELPFRTILVPLDGSDLARTALPAVKEFARASGSRVVLLNVFEGDPRRPDRDALPKPLDEPRKELEACGIEVSTDHRMGDASEEILKSAGENRADAIAMSTHGRSGPSRWVFGSITEKVLRASTLPLIVVRGIRVPAAGEKRGAAPVHRSTVI